MAEQASAAPSGFPTISFMSANYVAKQLDFKMTEGWGQGDQATNAYYRPLDTFGERFDALLREISTMGFDALDLWTAHLNWAWATKDHLAIARELLQRHDLQVVSLAGSFGATRAEFEAACRLAVEVGTTILGGNVQLLSSERAAVVSLLKEHGLKLAIENHPEKSPEEMLEKIGDGGDGTIGTAVDTGWYGTQAYDAVQAIERLEEHIMHVHLKDVLATGAHETCRYGQGVVPIEACVKTLKRIGYSGAYSIEHEPDHYDPTEDCRAMLPMLRGWLER